MITHATHDQSQETPNALYSHLIRNGIPMFVYQLHLLFGQLSVQVRVLQVGMVALLHCNSHHALSIATY